jgi:hypothetical protein
MRYTCRPQFDVYKVAECERMSDNYYAKTNTANYGGLKQLNQPTVIQSLYADAFILHPLAKRTDFLAAVTMPSKRSLLVSDKFIKLLANFNLPNHQIFEAWVEHRKKRYAYKIIHFTDNYLNAIDFKMSTFYWVYGYNNAEKRLFINNISDYEQSITNSDPPHRIFKANKLFFHSDDIINVDIFALYDNLPALAFFSDRLKNAIESANLSGIAFEPVGEYLKANLKWLDTGLPVED